MQEVSLAFLRLLEHQLGLTGRQLGSLLPGTLLPHRYEVQVQLAPGSAHLWRLAVARCHYTDLVREPARPSQHTSNAVIERRNSVAVCSGGAITGTQNLLFMSYTMYVYTILSRFVAEGRRS